MRSNPTSEVAGGRQRSPTSEANCGRLGAPTPAKFFLVHCRQVICFVLNFELDRTFRLASRRAFLSRENCESLLFSV